MTPTDLKVPQVKRMSVKDWLGGVITAYDRGRTPVNGLYSSDNTFLTQNGTVKPRPSLVPIGPQPQGKVLGEIAEFKKVTGASSENWLICMQSFNVSPSSSASSSASHSLSPSSSASPSASQSNSPSSSSSPSSSQSRSPSSSTSSSVSCSLSPSASLSNSPSSSASPSASVSASPSPPYNPYAQVFIARIEDASWTPCSGKYYNSTAKAHFFQIAGKVVIMNGVDNLSYLDISNSTITNFTYVANPSAPTLANNNVNTGSVGTITYRVTCNSAVGETAASDVLSTTVDTDREAWKPPSAGGTDNIIITLPAAPANAVSWNIYMGTVTGYEYLIASGIPITSSTFTDDGSLAQDNTRLYPTVNSTAGPKVTRGANINGRAFLVGDTDNPYYVRWGGDYKYEMDFSPANGGGFVPVGNAKDVPNRVIMGRDAQGHSVIKVYCQGTSGIGKTFSLTPDTVTYGTTVIAFYDVTEDEGMGGSDSPDGILHYDNSMWYPSRDGFKTDGSVPQLQNVIKNRRISNTIQPDLSLINQSAMDGCVGVASEGKLYWALPVSADSNNEIWVLDLDRKGAWMKPWSIAADWMWLYNDNTGNKRHLILSNNKIYELSYSQLTNDDGDTFTTSGQSGEIYFSDDKRMWVQLLKVIFLVLSPLGEINFQISGKTEDSPYQTVGEPTVFNAESNTDVAGWGEVNSELKGFGRQAWSEVNTVPTTVHTSTQEVPIDIDEEIQFATYSWHTTKPNVDYAISDVIFEYVEIGIKDLE